MRGSIWDLCCPRGRSECYRRLCSFALSRRRTDTENNTVIHPIPESVPIYIFRSLPEKAGFLLYNRNA
jgi:hypothetical protein